MPNARDLGGLPLEDGTGVTDCGKVIRTPSPQFLSKEGAVELYQYGVRTVIDLRSPIEARNEGNGPLEEYYNSGRINRIELSLLSDNQRATDPVGTPEASNDPALHYINYLHDGLLFTHLAQAVIATSLADGATMIHCALGKDRTGIAVAILLDAVGTDHSAIIDDYALTAPHLVEMVDRLGSNGSYSRDFSSPDWEALAPRPEGISGTLQWIARTHGGSASYLRNHGLHSDQLSQLRSQLRYDPTKTLR